MKINRSELQHSLEKVKPGLSNKEIIEQSTSFAFMGDRVVTYNDTISISHPIKGLDVTGAIKAQELYQFLNKVKKDDIHILSEDNEIIIKAGKSKAGLVLQNEIRLPIDEVGAIDKWKKVPDQLLDALKACYPNCSKDMSRPILTCVHVRKDGKVEASDSYRIMQYRLGDKLPIDAFLIPADSVRELVRYNITHIAKGEGWVHFKSKEGTIFSCRIFEDTYPQIQNILEFDGVEIKLPASLQEALEKAQIFSKSEIAIDSMVSIDIGKGKIKVSANADFGWFEETTRIKYDEDPVSFKANPEFLMDMLNQVQTCVYGDSKIRFSATNWDHVIALTDK